MVRWNSLIKALKICYTIGHFVISQVGNAEGVNTNIGNVRNQEVLKLRYSNTVAMRKHNFEWDIDVNLSTLKNEVTYLPGGSYVYTLRTAGYKLEEGHSLYEFYMAKNAGLILKTGICVTGLKMATADGKQPRIIQI